MSRSQFLMRLEPEWNSLTPMPVSFLLAHFQWNGIKSQIIYVYVPMIFFKLFDSDLDVYFTFTGWQHQLPSLRAYCALAHRCSPLFLLLSPRSRHTTLILCLRKCQVWKGVSDRVPTASKPELVNITWYHNIHAPLPGPQPFTIKLCK